MITALDSWKAYFRKPSIPSYPRVAIHELCLESTGFFAAREAEPQLRDLHVRAEAQNLVEPPHEPFAWTTAWNLNLESRNDRPADAPTVRRAWLGIRSYRQGILFGLCFPYVSPTSALSSSDFFTRFFAQYTLLLAPRGGSGVLTRSNRNAMPGSSRPLQ
jgi:hypothetical protein